MTKKILVDPTYGQFDIKHKEYERVPAPVPQEPNTAYEPSLFRQFGTHLRRRCLQYVAFFGLFGYVGIFGTPVQDIFAPKPKAKMWYEQKNTNVVFESESGGRLELIISDEANTLIREGILHHDARNPPLTTHDRYKMHMEMNQDNDRTIRIEEAKRFRDRMREGQ